MMPPPIPSTRASDLAVQKSMSMVGWSTIVVSIILVISEVIGFLVAASLNQVEFLLRSLPSARVQAMYPILTLLRVQRYWSLYMALFFVVVLVAAIQFLRLREKGRWMLEVACWAGVVNACIDTTVSYLTWDSMEDLTSGLRESMGVRLPDINTVGVGSIVLGFFLWVIPCIAMALYLRRESVRAQMKSERAASPAVRTGAPQS